VVNAARTSRARQGDLTRVGPAIGGRGGIEEATVPQLQRSMASARRTARSITEFYLSRIEALNTSGPELRAIITTNPDALDIADRLDAERQARGPRGPLHGIPVAIKDNIDTHDRMATTAGSFALEARAHQDAFVVAKLRQAGAVVLAKANLTEWAGFRDERSSSGWSARGGQGRNPYALDRTPGGSSSGSAVAVAANLTALSIGTETRGSILCPASINGAVGIKPTVGLWSRSGMVPISQSQDTAGPMTRTVRDAAILLGALTASTGRTLRPRTASVTRRRTTRRTWIDPVSRERGLVWSGAFPSLTGAWLRCLIRPSRR